ncbi:hypersensitive-induced response protein [Nannochloropsis gaditana]|uniref:Hypersensitive-induced response protein n=1 Tax=Nannochloropsis gaditana TaxID=72520 RepID=W7TY57_9STRA|nr:hypersensitive-induced response protein [Nannochloropsis gaditana]
MGESCLCCACVSTGEVGVVERNCKYNRLGLPGITLMCWPFEAMQSRVSLRIMQLDIRAETKTKDNVFVMVYISIQYQVIREKVFDAVYRLTNPQEQIRAYVYDVVRATLPRMFLDEAFEAKDDIAHAVKASLQTCMGTYGYSILNALVTDLEPDLRVKAAMNEINASKRLKEAARERAEGEKIVQVKIAEANAESKYLSGVGVAKQRKAIVDGLRESILGFSGNVPGTTAKDVMDLMLLTQYFDMLNLVGNNPSTNTVFIPHKPALAQNGEEEVGDQVRNGMLQAQSRFAHARMGR